MVLKANTDAFIAEPEAAERTWSGPAFWVRWVGVTALGWAISYGVVIAIILESRQAESVLTRGTSMVFTLAILVLQWLVLRPWMERAWRWVPVSFAGDAIGLALFLLSREALRATLGGPTIIPESVLETLVFGLPSVIAQWLLLRTVARSASRWIVANLIWLLIHFPISLGLAFTAELIESPVVWALIGGVLGFIASGIVGAEMAWLLRHPKHNPRAPIAE